MTNTALPTIARELDIAAAASIWAVNIYYLTVVAALLPLAALGEIYGHRRVFFAGLVMFVLGAIGSGLAWSLPSLSAARAILGIGAAAISAVTPALIRFICPPEKLGRGMGVDACWSAVRTPCSFAPKRAGPIPGWSRYSVARPALS